MGLVNKKRLIQYLCLTTIITTLLSSCNHSNTEVKPDPNMVLEVAVFEAIVNEEYINNPWYKNSFGSSRLFRNLFITDARTGEINMDLAEDYIVSDDGLTYEITLKDNLKWSDGETLDLDDVIFSIENCFFLQLPNTLFITTFAGIEGAKDYLENPELINHIDGLEVIDNTLKITLETPNHLFIDTLSQFSILPKHKLENIDLEELPESEFWKNIVSSGIYKIGEYVSNEYLELIHNDLYTEKTPYINSIKLHSNYELGNLDYYETSNIAEILEYRSATHTTEYIANNLFYRYLVFNIEKQGEIDPVLSDIRVRQAITYAIDRETLIKNIYYDTGDIFNTGVIEEYNQPINVDYPYDPEKAIALLKEANYDFNRPIELLYYYTDDISTAFIEEVAKYLEAVGFTVNITKEGHLFTDEYDYYDIGLKGLSAFSNVDWYNEYLSTSQLHTDIFGGDPLFDELIEELNQVTKTKDKIDILKKLQELEYELLYKYPIFLMGHNIYIDNTIDIPNDVVFGDSKYKYDIQIEEWKINDTSESRKYTEIIILAFIIIIFIGKRLLKTNKELKHNKQLSENMYIDIATGIYNSSKCQEIMKTPPLKENSEKDRGIIIFDLNDLKKTNDNLGHRAGDQLIYDFAQQIKNATNKFENEIFVGRYGGDEFIAFLDNIEEVQINNYINEVNYLIDKFNETEDKGYVLSCAIGYCITNQNNKSMTVKELFDIADENMYNNKIKMKEARSKSKD